LSFFLNHDPPTVSRFHSAFHPDRTSVSFRLPHLSEFRPASKIFSSPIPDAQTFSSWSFFVSLRQRPLGVTWQAAALISALLQYSLSSFQFVVLFSRCSHWPRGDWFPRHHPPGPEAFFAVLFAAFPRRDIPAATSPPLIPSPLNIIFLSCLGPSPFLRHAAQSVDRRSHSCPSRIVMRNDFFVVGDTFCPGAPHFLETS